MRKITAHSEGTTKDIMYSLVSAAPAAVNQYNNFPYENKFIPAGGATLQETGKAASAYIKNLVKYQIDPFGIQNIQLPARLVERGSGDCKSLSLFLYAILTSLGYKGGFRFGRYRKNGSFTHVYNYFLDNNGKIVTFDVCTADFEEIKPIETYDMEINYIAEAPVITRRKKQRRKVIVQSTKPRLVDLLQDDRVYNPVSGIGKRQKGKWKDKLKGIVNKAKNAGRGLVNKVGKGVKTVALAPARGPFLVLVNVNFRGLARRLSLLRDKSPSKYTEFWTKLGGDISALNEAVNKGKGKKAFLREKKGIKGFDMIDNTGVGDIYSDMDGIGVEPATVTAAITAASGIVVAAMKLLKKENVSAGPGEENTADLPADPITEPGTDFVATDPATEEAAEYAVTGKLPATGRALPAVPGSSTGFRPSPALLIGGAAALGLVLFTMKKKKR